jgi:hypothetical protein
VIKDPNIHGQTSSPLQVKEQLEKHLGIKGSEGEVKLFQI